MREDKVRVEVIADTLQFDQSMRAITEATRDFGRVFTSTISSSIRSGKGFDDFLKNLGRRFANLALNKALKPLEDLFGNFLNSAVSSIGSGIGGAPVPFARGGVVSSPTLFNFGQRLGVMGEAGPEAILPLQRSADGRLGVTSNGGNSRPVNVVFNVQSTDAASFGKSEGQITAMLARAVSRGQRGL